MVGKKKIKTGFHLRLSLGDVVRHEDEGGDMDSELAKDGAHDVDVEDVWLWALLGQRLD